MKLRVIIYWLVLAVFLLSGVSAYAHTWYIKPDGTGDASTIQAGVDSAIAGDTVLVAPGEYSEIIRIKSGVCLISELGPNLTKIILMPNPDIYYAILGDNIDGGIHRTEINGFWVEGVTWGTLGAICLVNCEYTYVLNNIVTGNAIGICLSAGNVVLMNNTCYGNSQYGIDGSDGGGGLMMFNIIWDRADGFYVALYSIWNNFMNLSDAYPYEVNNFSQDPEFCGAEAGNFYLQSDSPCAPGNPHSGSYLIGALPVGCGITTAESKTWGEIKAIYKK